MLAGGAGSAADAGPPLVLSVEPAAIAENGGAATVTVRTANGALADRRRTIPLSVAGSAAPGIDFRLADAAGRTLGKPFALVLPAGARAVSGTLRALDDDRDDDAETVVFAIGGAPETRRTATIADDDPPAPAPPRLEDLSVSRAHGPMYPAFDPETFHYAVKCGAPGRLRLRVAAAGARTRTAVDGRVLPSRIAELEFTDTRGDRDFGIALEGAHGGRAVYTLHCIPNNFPEVEVERRPGAWAGLIAVSLELRARGRRGGWIALLDANGVPRFHRRVSEDGRVSHFRPHAGTPHPYSVALQRGALGGDENWEIALLDADLNETARVRTTGLRHTDNHDFVATRDGSLAFLAYEPAVRDLRGHIDGQGNPYGERAAVRDSIIQRIGSHGRETLRWNSRGRFALADCAADGRLDEEYAHVNSLQAVDGDLVASFRGCSQVLRIDGATGAVVWRLGDSTRPDAEWTAAGSAPPLRLVGDPRGGFCRQHAARLVGNGNLLLFDNGGGACPEDPATGVRTRPAGGPSRAVEYALDPAAGTATFLREHALGGADGGYARAQGHVELMDNGNWLVSWGIGPSTSVTEWDPETGETPLTIRFRDADLDMAVRAYPVRAGARPRRPGR